MAGGEILKRVHANFQSLKTFNAAAFGEMMDRSTAGGYKNFLRTCGMGRLIRLK